MKSSFRFALVLVAFWSRFGWSVARFALVFSVSKRTTIANFANPMRQNVQLSPILRIRRVKTVFGWFSAGRPFSAGFRLVAGFPPVFFFFAGFRWFFAGKLFFAGFSLVFRWFSLVFRWFFAIVMNWNELA